MFAGETSVFTGLATTEVVAELADDEFGAPLSLDAKTSSEASSLQPTHTANVIINVQTAEILANVRMVDIQESFRGFLNDSVTLIKMKFFVRIVLISNVSVKINRKHPLSDSLTGAGTQPARGA